MTDHDGRSRPEGGGHPGGQPESGGRSPSVATGQTTLGVSRVRPDRSRHPSSADGQHDGSPLSDERRPRDDNRDPVGFESRENGTVTREPWKAIAFVCFVLVTLALVAETGVQIAAGLDVLALGPHDVALLCRIDAALATTATRARYVAVAAGGFAVVLVGAATLVVAIRAHT
ncbi:hypothetical protein [Haloparvum sp. AD34]